MDYNDNEYEGHNLHLTGEESSKNSSVLRPFALPKFDFDDSLHGHLRFDSLVENEGFLGIASQEDNQWIEEYSQGGNGIGFSSSAAESCALSRHINVWSEATSSESVEMLLKSVGQEEMIPGENMMEGLHPVGPQDGSTIQVEQLRQDGKTEGVCMDPSLPSTEADGNFSRSNESPGAGEIHAEYHLQQAQDTEFSSYGVYLDSKDNSVTAASVSNIDVDKISDKHDETGDLVNEPVSNQVQGGSPLPSKEAYNAESNSQDAAGSLGEYCGVDKISEATVVGSSCVEEGISDSAELQVEYCNTNDERSSGIVVETNKTEKHSAHELPSKMETLEEVPAVEIQTTNCGETSDMIGNGKSLSTNYEGQGKSLSTNSECNEVALVDEGIGGTLISSVTEVGPPSEDNSGLHENSSISLEGEGIHFSDVTPAIDGNNETKEVPMIQQSDQHSNLDAKENIGLGTSTPVEMTASAFESSVSHEVKCNPDEDGDKNINPAEELNNLKEHAISGERPEDGGVTKDMRVAGNIAAMPENEIKDGDLIHPSTITGNIQTHAEDIASMEVDAPQSDFGGSAQDYKDKKSPHGSSDMGCVDIAKDTASAFSGVMNTEKTSDPQHNSYAGDYPVLNVEGEDTNLTSSSVEKNEIHGQHEEIPPSCDAGYKGQIKETESEIRELPSTSVTKEFLKTSEVGPAIETEKEVDPAVQETPISNKSPTLIEKSSVAMSGEAFNEVNEMMEHSTHSLTAQDDGADTALTVKPMEGEKGKSIGTNSSSVSVASSTIEIDKHNQATEPSTSSNDLAQSGMDKQTSLELKIEKKHVDVLTESKNSGENVTSKEETTFTFDIRPLGGHLTRDSAKSSQSLPGIQPCKLLSSSGPGSPSISLSSQTDAVMVAESFHTSSPTVGVSSPSTERRGRRASSKSGKGSTRKGNQAKETTPTRQSEKVGKSPHFLSPLGPSPLVTYESVLKPRAGVSGGLPDLNSSSPSSAFFQQPFTDLQQVQLRAQIFVYGSLIQGAAPDEACMVSAFDGARSAWESSWRTCIERLHSQKGNNSETPMSTRPASKASDQTNTPGFQQNEVISSVASRANNKPIQSPAASPLLPLSSPLWSIATPSSEALPPSSMTRSFVFDYQAISPLNPYQTPPGRNYIAHSAGPSQAPFPVPWLPSSQSSPFNISASYPAFPALDPLKVTPAKESPLPVTSGAKQTSPAPASATVASSVFSGTPLPESKKVKVSSGQTADTKIRKRKKSTSVENAVQISMAAAPSDSLSTSVLANQLSKRPPIVESLSQIPLIAPNQAGSLPSPIVSSHYSTPVTVLTPSSFVQKSTSNQFSSPIPPSIPTDPVRGNLGTDRKSLSTESCSKVEEAKSQAEEAAAHAAAAVSQCEGVWSQLDWQTKSGMMSDAESKLASSAVAIAAAVSVAKAAAAAAKIAASAAVQAKQMADEAVTASNSINLVNSSPLTTLKGGNQKSAPSSAISAAREAARKRIEAASAATRHAENLDAILRAAELAADAVSHAGKLVTMGDPFSLSELARAGPNNYWKGLQAGDVHGAKSDDTSKNKSISNDAGQVPSVPRNQNVEPEGDTHVTNNAISPTGREFSKNIDDHTVAENHNKEESELARNADGVSNLDTELRSNSVIFTSIKEGSHVEILKDRGDLRKAWFMATVLSLKDVEALVRYTDLRSDEGSEHLREWISIEVKAGVAPKIRVPHPMTSVQLEGTRKRRRAAAKDYTWSIGDKVDAWVQDCWCEGVIVEKNKKDSTAFGIHFPAQEETLMVKEWHLRPTLIWSDGQWSEWHRPREDGTAAQGGDTPLEKRTKLGSTTIETKEKGKMAKNLTFGESVRNEETSLPLAVNEKVFSIGSTKEDSKPNTVKTMKSGSEREGGSRVVFGVPKPGKKRKFMDVSKHYHGTAKTTVPNDSVKLAKFLGPQSGSRGFRSNVKPDFKEKQVPAPKPRVPKLGKPPTIPRRTAAKRVDSTSSHPNVSDAATSDNTGKGSVSNNDNDSGEQSLTEYGSSSNAEGTSGMVFSSQAISQENRRKAGAATRNVRSERRNQVKLGPAGGKSAKDEGNEKLSSDASEPRRSNRRIQPTYRLLEGLQTSMITSSSHDKGHRSQIKGSISRGNTSRG